MKLSLFLPENGFVGLAVFGPVLRQSRQHGRVSAPSRISAKLDLARDERERDHD
jgi:hypothetical protein